MDKDNIQEGKIAELLKPRYKVIADWPNTALQVGEIIFADTYRDIKYFDKYPHLFKKLEWWEDREEKDMPQYLKYATQKYSAKPFVVYPAKFTKEENGWTVEVEGTVIPHGNYLKDKLPASEEEFNNQNK